MRSWCFVRDTSGQDGIFGEEAGLWLVIWQRVKVSEMRKDGKRPLQGAFIYTMCARPRTDFPRICSPLNWDSLPSAMRVLETAV